MSQQLKKTAPWLVLPALVIAFAVIGFWPVQQLGFATDDNNDGIEDCTPKWTLNGFSATSGSHEDESKRSSSNAYTTIDPADGVFELGSELEVDTRQDHECKDFSVEVFSMSGQLIKKFNHEGVDKDTQMFQLTLSEEKRGLIGPSGDIIVKLVCSVHQRVLGSEKLGLNLSSMEDSSTEDSTDPPNCSSCDDCGESKPSLSCIKYPIKLGDAGFGKSRAVLTYFDRSGSTNKGIGNLILGANSEFTVTRDANGNLSTVEGDYYTVIAPVAGGSNNAFTVEVSTDKANPGGTMVARYAFEQSNYVYDGQNLISLLITKENRSGTTILSSETTRYAFKPALGNDIYGAGALWIMEDGNGLRRTLLETVAVGESSKQERKSVYERGSISTAWDNAAVHKMSERDVYWQSFPWGKEMVKQVIDPSGSQLTSTWTYYGD